MDLKKPNTFSNKSKGIICILFAALGFSFMTFFVRISGDIPTMEKAFFRNAVAIVVSLFMLVRTKEKISINNKRTETGTSLIRYQNNVLTKI